jgi:hypothetical protein
MLSSIVNLRFPMPDMFLVEVCLGSYMQLNSVSKNCRIGASSAARPVQFHIRHGILTNFEEYTDGYT